MPCRLCSLGAVDHVSQACAERLVHWRDQYDFPGRVLVQIPVAPHPVAGEWADLGNQAAVRDYHQGLLWSEPGPVPQDGPVALGYLSTIYWGNRGAARRQFQDAHHGPTRGRAVDAVVRARDHLHDGANGAACSAALDVLLAADRIQLGIAFATKVLGFAAPGRAIVFDQHIANWLNCQINHPQVGARQHGWELIPTNTQYGFPTGAAMYERLCDLAQSVAEAMPPAFGQWRSCDIEMALFKHQQVQARARPQVARPNRGWGVCAD